MSCSVGQVPWLEWLSSEAGSPGGCLYWSRSEAIKAGLGQEWKKGMKEGSSKEKSRDWEPPAVGESAATDASKVMVLSGAVLPRG